MQLPTAEGQNPTTVKTDTLIMPIDGFVQSFRMMDAMVKRLISDGVLRQQPPAVTTETETKQ